MRTRAGIVLAILVGVGALLVGFSAMGSPAILVGLGGLTACGMVATLYARGTLDRETLYLALILIAMVCGVLMA
jgi:hypothetical protein